MSEVQFEDNNPRYAAQRFESLDAQPSKLALFVIKMGIAKEEQTANYVLIGVAVVSFIVALYVLKDTFSVHPPPQNQNIILLLQKKGVR
ncbi:MAG: hypothetical protein NUV54_01780 [Candidatus Taylorbacteria bacterium]|nr:hypothetical protein [Candidatus Taylorbacteria bacterium]